MDRDELLEMLKTYLTVELSSPREYGDSEGSHNIKLVVKFAGSVVTEDSVYISPNSI